MDNIYDVMSSRVKDYIGYKFHLLTIIERDGYHIGSTGTKIVKWKCRCECGNETSILVGSAFR